MAIRINPLDVEIIHRFAHVHKFRGSQKYYAAYLKMMCRKSFDKEAPIWGRLAQKVEIIKKEIKYDPVRGLSDRQVAVIQIVAIVFLYSLLFREFAPKFIKY